MRFRKGKMPLSVAILMERVPAGVKDARADGEATIASRVGRERGPDGSPPVSPDRALSWNVGSSGPPRTTQVRTNPEFER